MTEKERSVTLARTGRSTITDLCVDFGISRKTGGRMGRSQSNYPCILDIGGSMNEGRSSKFPSCLLCSLLRLSGWVSLPSSLVELCRTRRSKAFKNLVHTERGKAV